MQLCLCQWPGCGWQRPCRWLICDSARIQSPRATPRRHRFSQQRLHEHCSQDRCPGGSVERSAPASSRGADSQRGTAKPCIHVDWNPGILLTDLAKSRNISELYHMLWSQALNNDSVKYECMKMNLQACKSLEMRKWRYACFSRRACAKATEHNSGMHPG